MKQVASRQVYSAENRPHSMSASVCPSDNILLDFIEGRLPREAADDVQSHMDACEDCLQLLVELGGAAPVPAGAGDAEDADQYAFCAEAVQVAEFRVLRPLGQGAMGQVYLARDEFLDRLVAIKFLMALEGGESARQRFYTEARAIARLQHPNVVTLYRVGEENGRPYLVSEFVEGESLDKRKTPMPWKRVRAIALGLARGTAAAHQRGVLHRDIKPANVMLGAQDEVKLLDFGLAKLLHLRAGDADAEGEHATSEPRDRIRRLSHLLSVSRQSLSKTGTLLGTPLYMAPEVWAGEPASVRSDIYSLGAVLYELCTGHPPHRADRIKDLRQQVRGENSPPLSKLIPNVDADLARVIDRCLRRNPQERFASCEDMAQALEAIGRKRSMFRAAAVVGAAAVLAVVCVLGFLSLQQAKMERLSAAEREHRKKQEQQAQWTRQIELGERAAELARQPGKELEALKTAIMAVGPSFINHQQPPREAAVGLSSALTSRPYLPAPRLIAAVGNLQQTHGHFSPNGKQILIHPNDSYLFDTTTGRELAQFEGGLYHAGFSSDGSQVLTLSNEHLRLWDVATRNLRLSISAAYKNEISPMPFSAEGRAPLALTDCSMSSRVDLFDISRAHVQAHLYGHNNCVFSANFSKDYHKVITASKDGTVRIWNSSTGELYPPVLKHSNPVWQAKYVFRDESILTLDTNHTIRKWDASSGKLLFEVGGKQRAITAANFSLDGAYLAVSSSRGDLQLLNGRDGQMRNTLSSSGASTQYLDFSEDGRLLATFSGRLAEFWDVKRGKLLGTLLAAAGPITFWEFAPDASQVIIGAGNAVWIWKLPRLADQSDQTPVTSRDAQSVKKIDPCLNGNCSVPLTISQTPAFAARHPSGARSTLSPNSQRAVTSAQNTNLWDARTGRWLAELSSGSKYASVAFSPNSEFIVASEDSRIDLWSARSGQFLRSLGGHEGLVHDIAFSSDSRRILTASSDRTVRLFNVQSGEVTNIFYSPQTVPHSARFSADEQEVAVTGTDGSVQRHPTSVSSQLAAACELLAHGLTDAEIREACQASIQQEQRNQLPLKNLDVSTGLPGSAPTDWLLPGFAEQAGYRAAQELNCPHPGQNCVLLRAPVGAPVPAGYLSQRIPAAQFRGKRVRLRALVSMVRLTANSSAHLAIGVHTSRAGLSFSNDPRSSPVVTERWQSYEVVADVPQTAIALEVSLVLRGAGRVRFANVSFESVAPEPSNNPWHAKPTNLDFRGGAFGGIPVGWSLHNEGIQNGYWVQVSADDPNGNLPVACINRSSPVEGRYSGALSQVFDATTYQGKRVRLRAMARLQQGQQRVPTRTVNLSLNALTPDGLHLLAEDQPITETEWSEVDIVTDIPNAARTIEIEIYLADYSPVCLRDMSFSTVDPATPMRGIGIHYMITNPGMEVGQPGDEPAGWLVKPSRSSGFRALLSKETPSHGQQCVRLIIEKELPPPGFGHVFQGVSAINYRGKRIRLLASVRAEVANDDSTPEPPNRAQLWLRVDREHGQRGAFENMARRSIIDRGWREYEIIVDVAPDAEAIYFGLLLFGRGQAWLDNVSLEVVGDASTPRPLDR